MYKIILCFLILGLTPLTVAKPTREEAKAFVDYFFNGKKNREGPIVADMILCGKIRREGSQKNDCAKKIENNFLKVKQEAFVWLHFIAPQGSKIGNITIQWDLDGEVKKTRSINIEGSIRYRVWRAFTPQEKGEWNVQVLYGKSSVPEVLAEMPITVVE